MICVNLDVPVRRCEIVDAQVGRKIVIGFDVPREEDVPVRYVDGNGERQEHPDGAVVRPNQLTFDPLAEVFVWLAAHRCRRYRSHE